MDIIEVQSERDVLRGTVHELRNIFCIVIGNLELLRMHADPHETEMIDRALSGTKRGDLVINTLTNLVANKKSAVFVASPLAVGD